MGGLISSPKRVRIPPAAEPPPAQEPVPLDVEVLEKEREKRRQKIRQRGRAGTVLTEGGLGTSSDASKKGTLLGGSAT
jgi:hypothetical protein